MPVQLGFAAERKSSQPVCPAFLRSMRPIGPPPPPATEPSVTSEYCRAGGAMPHAPAALCPESLPTTKPPALLNPWYPGSGYHRSPPSSGSSVPAKVDEADVPEEAAAAPVDHDAIRAPCTSPLP